MAFQSTHELPAGCLAYLPTESVLSSYVKHPNGSWLNVQPPREAFARNNVSKSTKYSECLFWFESSRQLQVSPLQIIHQNTYRSGVAPVDDQVVPFNVPMSAANRGEVSDPAGHAFTAELTTREKVSICFGVREGNHLLRFVHRECD